MGVIISLLVSIVFAAIIVWVADWTARPQTVLDILNQRFARGENVFNAKRSAAFNSPLREAALHASAVTPPPHKPVDAASNQKHWEARTHERPRNRSMVRDG